MSEAKFEAVKFEIENIENVFEFVRGFCFQITKINGMTSFTFFPNPKNLKGKTVKVGEWIYKLPSGEFGTCKSGKLESIIKKVENDYYETNN